MLIIYLLDILSNISILKESIPKNKKNLSSTELKRKKLFYQTAI